METYYAYVHAKPTDEGAKSIFYVGKGNLRRVNLLNRNTRNLHYSRTVKKHGAENILIGKMECSSESIAFDLERGLIKCLRRMSVKLTNLTDGGEGSSGYKATAEQREKLSDSSKRMWADADKRAAITAAQTLAQRSVDVTEKKRDTAKANIAKGRAVLSNPEVKVAAAKKNSEKSLAMWSNAEFKDSTIKAMKDCWTDDKRAAKGDDVRGRKRVTNGTEERNVRPEELAGYLLNGWVAGRKQRVSNKRPRGENTNL